MIFRYGTRARGREGLAVNSQGASVDTLRCSMTSATDVAAIAEVSASPGLIDTPMGRWELDRQPIIPTMIEVTPVRRPYRPLPGRPEDIAAAVSFLESDAAAFISGCDLRVDGELVGAGKHLMDAG
jgi:NAD(P)-dependent dehydrogenase (short-subunit alcohol dehydrogenase family)